jgi:hypothetical protein
MASIVLFLIRQTYFYIQNLRRFSLVSVDHVAAESGPGLVGTDNEVSACFTLDKIMAVWNIYAKDQLNKHMAVAFSDGKFFLRENLKSTWNRKIWKRLRRA